MNERRRSLKTSKSVRAPPGAAPPPAPPAPASSPATPVLGEKLRWERMRNGQCPTCGIQLFKIKGKGMFRRNKEMEPITVRDQVKNGKCMFCIDNKTPATATTDEEGKNKQGEVAVAAGAQDQDRPPEIILADEEAFQASFRRTGDLEDFENDCEGDLISLYSQNLVNPFMTSRPLKENFARRISMEEFACYPNPRVECIYEGDFGENGTREGRGDLIWPNGDRYSGEFVRNTRHGHGSMFFEDDGEYIGAWCNDKMHGEGERKYCNGDVYKGEFINGLREGKGRYLFANGDIYTGEFENDEFHGHGRFEYATEGPKPCYFEGTFVNGNRVGKGEFFLATGDLDVQRYRNDERVAEGVRFSADRKTLLRLQGNAVREELNELEAAQLDNNCDCDLWETLDG